MKAVGMKKIAVMLVVFWLPLCVASVALDDE